MKNKELKLVLDAHNHRLIRIDAQKLLVEKLFKDLQQQLFTLNEDWD